MNPVDRGREHATNGKHEAAIGDKLVEKAWADLERRPQWRSEPVGLETAQTLAEMVRPGKSIIRSAFIERGLEQARRRSNAGDIAAGLAFAMLRRSFGREDEWKAAAGESLSELGLERVEQLIGKVEYFKSTATCVGCGIGITCQCGCGKPYLPLVPWTVEEASPPKSPLERAIVAITADPSRSNRLIAKDIGVSFETVRRARSNVSTGVSPDKRTGRDGRHYPASHDKDDRAEDPPGNARVAFLLRADTASEFATYSGPEKEVDEDCCKLAEEAASAWINLAQRLREMKR